MDELALQGADPAPLMLHDTTSKFSNINFFRLQLSDPASPLATCAEDEPAPGRHLAVPPLKQVLGAGGLLPICERRGRGVESTGQWACESAPMTGCDRPDFVIPAPSGHQTITVHHPCFFLVSQRAHLLVLRPGHSRPCVRFAVITELPQARRHRRGDAVKRFRSC